MGRIVYVRAMLRHPCTRLTVLENFHLQTMNSSPDAAAGPLLLRSFGMSIFARLVARGEDAEGCFLITPLQAHPASSSLLCVAASQLLRRDIGAERTDRLVDADSKFTLEC